MKINEKKDNNKDMKKAAGGVVDSPNDRLLQSKMSNLQQCMSFIQQHNSDFLTH